MRDVTLVILNSLRIKCRIRRPLTVKVAAVMWREAMFSRD